MILCFMLGLSQMLSEAGPSTDQLVPLRSQTLTKRPTALARGVVVALLLLRNPPPRSRANQACLTPSRARWTSNPSSTRGRSRPSTPRQTNRFGLSPKRLPKKSSKSTPPFSQPFPIFRRTGPYRRVGIAYLFSKRPYEHGDQKPSNYLAANSPARHGVAAILESPPGAGAPQT